MTQSKADEAERDAWWRGFCEKHGVVADTPMPLTCQESWNAANSAALREAQAEIERLNSLGRERDGAKSDVGRGHRGGGAVLRDYKPNLPAGLADEITRKRADIERKLKLP